MYTQRKKIGIKVCRLKIAFFSDGKVETMNEDIIGSHLNLRQADKYVRKNFGMGYSLLSFTNDVEYVNLDIEKIYNEHMGAKNEKE